LLRKEKEKSKTLRVFDFSMHFHELACILSFILFFSSFFFSCFLINAWSAVCSNQIAEHRFCPHRGCDRRFGFGGGQPVP
jgi:hypothetical protein